MFCVELINKKFFDGRTPEREDVWLRRNSSGEFFVVRESNVSTDVFDFGVAFFVYEDVAYKKAKAWAKEEGETFRIHKVVVTLPPTYRSAEHYTPDGKYVGHVPTDEELNV